MNKQFYLDLSLPFEGSSPAGVDISESELYEQVERELEKSQSLQNESTDWTKVLDLSTQLLAEQTKDLRLVNFLTFSLYNKYSFEGLEVGLSLLANISSAEYWDDIYPKRKKRQSKARAASFDWLVKRIEPIIQSLKVTSESDFQQLIDLAETFNKATISLDNRLESDKPNTAAVRKCLERIVLEAKAWNAEIEENKQKHGFGHRAKEVVNKVVDTVTEPFKPKSEKNSGTEVDLLKEQSSEKIEIKATQPMLKVSMDEIDNALGSCRQTLESVASALKEVNRYDPRAFYLSRMAKWMMVDISPESGLMLQNPSGEQLEELQSFAKNSQHHDVIEQAEALFVGGAIYCFTLHRIIANSLDALGETVSSQIIKTSLALLVFRLPDLLECKFSNQQPFMDNLTANWLKSSVSVGNNSVDTNSSIEGSETKEEPWVAGLERALGLSAASDFDAGVAVMSEGINAAADLRAKTYWQFMLAKLCDSAGHHELAISQLNVLEARLKDSQLLAWEFSLRIEIVTYLLRSHIKQMAKVTYTPEQKQAIKPLYDELSLADPVTALSLVIKY